MRVPYALAQEVLGSIRQRRRWREGGTLDAIGRANVRTHGVHVIPGYWSTEQCALARERIDALLGDPSVRVTRDDVASDERIFGINRLSPEVDLLSDAKLQTWIQEFFGSSDIVGTTLGARLRYVPGNKGSGGGWHRDSAIAEQYKAILYLSDVRGENGPFQYALGSARRRAIWSAYLHGEARVAQSRFDDGDSPSILRRTEVRTFVASAGTLLLVDTRGVHRGAPIASGQRYTLTNYYFRQRIPPHIADLENQSSSLD